MGLGLGHSMAFEMELGLGHLMMLGHLMTMGLSWSLGFQKGANLGHRK